MDGSCVAAGFHLSFSAPDIIEQLGNLDFELVYLDGEHGRFDLRDLGHNSPAYLHALAEALNLAFADREAYVGDPKFVEVPVAGMLSPDYAASQRARIDAGKAFGRMPDPGRPDGAPPVTLAPPAPERGPVPPPMDTIYASAADADGNIYSATLSDNTYDTPMTPGMGLAMSSRGTQNRLTPGHPAQVAPGKRPRLTPSPALSLRDGKFHMAFGTPGGDIQCQAMLQVFLNSVEFGMPMQQAIEALDMRGNPVADLSPLKGMPLRKLGAEQTKVTDLTPLAGMPLEELYLSDTPVRDLSPLKGKTVTGKFSAGALTVKRVKLEDVKAEIEKRLADVKQEVALENMELTGENNGPVKIEVSWQDPV